MIKKQSLITAIVVLGLTASFGTGAKAQIVLTMEQALEYSAEHNPELKNSRMSMERYEQNLIAQKASLKSRFSLNLQPLSYSQSRQFDSRYSDWYTNRSLSSSGTFSISQPIKPFFVIVRYVQHIAAHNLDRCYAVSQQQFVMAEQRIYRRR